MRPGASSGGVACRAPLVILAAALGLGSAPAAHAVSVNALQFVEVRRDGVGGVDGLAGAFSVVVTPDGKHVYAAGFDEDALARFSRNAGTSSLTYLGLLRDGVGGVDGLDGVASLAVSPDGAHVYAAAYVDDAVARFSRNSGNGSLNYLGLVRDGVGGVDGLNGAAWVAVSPDGAHVYVAGSDEAAVAVFSRNAATGALTFVEVKKQGIQGLAGVSAVAVSPDGKHVYATGFDDDAVVVFSRNTTTGALAVVERLEGPAVPGLLGPLGLGVSPDGAHVYVAGNFDNAVVVLARNATTGRLTFVEVQRDGVGGVDGLWGADAVATSPDGKRLYVTGCFDDALAVFGRNPATGRLTFLERERDGRAGVDGLFGAIAVAASADGASVYAAAQLDDAVSVFRVLALPACANGVDDDGDGKIDLADPGCRHAAFPIENPACNDGIDNDGDGKIDLADLECWFASDRSERRNCSDGVDNDGDGLTDLADPACRTATAPLEERECEDRLDNDNDGRIDWDGGGVGPPDPDCADPWSDEAAGSCGLGGELALVLGTLSALRRRARRRVGSSG